MLHLSEWGRALPYYRPIPLTALPLIYHREHLFPYTSSGETESVPLDRVFRMLVLENDFLRVEVAPELGGRIYRLLDKRIGREILFSNPVVKPTRILPVWAFISGGMEFNFPIAHSPTSIATVGCSTGQTGDYGFIRVGEREARTGMEWVVELGLVADSPVLVQRTLLRNQTSADHPWMMWTIAAMDSTERTEFVHAPHRVLLHDHRILETDWPGEGLNWDRNAKQMTAFFWKPGGAPPFGVFQHESGGSGYGLLHLADPEQLPGKKIWTYGHGRHRSWSQATTTGGRAYVEIESGPLVDQGEKPLFPAGSERSFEEYWIPIHSREAFESAEWPKLDLPPMTDPWLGWGHSTWQVEWEAFRAGKGPLPVSAVPTGLELEEALRHAKNAEEPLALWLAFRQRPEEALVCVEKNSSPTAQRLAGLILWKALGEPQRAASHLAVGPLDDPVAVAELDALYAGLEWTSKRAALLAAAPSHRLIIERRADLALAQKNPDECLRLLTETTWPREHQRYVRSELWQRAQSALKNSASPPPESLGEDNLASFGAYWAD